MEERSDQELQRLAHKHACRLQLILAAVMLALALFVSLIYQRVEDGLESLDIGSNSDIAIFICLVPLGALLNLYVSWTAIWATLGSASWLRRVLAGLLIAHLTFIVAIYVTDWIATTRNGNRSSMDWRDALAIIAAFSYAIAGQLFASMFLVWLLKLWRVRLLYFDDPSRYPHPRVRGNRSLPIHDRPNTAIARGRVSLLDMLALITIFAFYLAAWKPIIDGWLPTNQMFGPAFAFVLFLAFIGTNGAVGLFLILIPLVISMLDRRGIASQLMLHAIHIVITGSAAGTIIYFNQGPEIIGLGVASIIVFASYLALLWMLMRRPSRLFRFRLLRAA